MQIEVYGSTGHGLIHHELVAVLEAFKSLRVTWNYPMTHHLVLQVNWSKEWFEYLKVDNALKVNNVYFIVHTMRVEGDVIEIQASSTSYRLDKLVVGSGTFGLYTAYAKPEEIAVELINRHGYIMLVQAKELTPFSPEKIRYQNSHGTVLEAVQKLAETYQFGLKEYAHKSPPGRNYLELFKPEDKSSWIEFSARNDNLLNEVFEQSILDLATIALVYGEGEGRDRISVRVTEGGDMSYERREIYVDARDLQRTDGMSELDYKELLKVRGKQKLAEQKAVLSLSGSINPHDTLFRLHEDYDVGDVVTIKSERFGLSQAIQLTSIEETWDETGYHVDPVFGKAPPTLLEKLRFV